MSDRGVTAGECDLLDAEWDALIMGRNGQAPAVNAADIAEMRALHARARVSPQLGRQIWSNAAARSERFAPGTQGSAATLHRRTVHLVAPAGSGLGWLPAGAVAVVAAVAILAGVLLGKGDGEGDSPALPSADASSVVATLPSSAPAWATPSDMFAD